MTVTTPLGGTATYAFQNVTDPQGHTHPTVSSRALGGRSVPGGTWQFSYNRSADPVVGSVLTPDGRTVEYKHQPIPNGTGGTYWNVVEKTLRRGGSIVSRVQRTFQGCGDGFAPMPQQIDVTEDGRTYTTTYQYRSVYEHNCDFHRPQQITQVGDLTRTVSQDYVYLPNRYRGDLIGSTSVTVGGDTTTTEFTVNADGFVTRTRVQGMDTQYTAGVGGNVGSLTDANGRTTSFAYEWGVLKTVQTPLYSISRLIDASGLIESETRRGITTSYSYDQAGRPTGVTAPLSDPVTITYNSDSVTTVQGPSQVTVDLDGFGRDTRSLDAAGVSVQTQYDAEGRVVVQTSAQDAGTTAHDTYGYDDLNRVTTVTHSGGGVVTISRTGSSISTTDENGRTTTQHLALFAPGDGRITSVVDPAGKTWLYQYNGFGGLTSVTQPQMTTYPSTGATTRSFVYDNRNRLVAETHPESGTTTYAYDDVGNLISKQDARGWVMQYAYDATDRLTAVNTTAVDSVTMTYDQAGNRTSVANGTAASTFVYDNANRLTSRTDVVAGKTFVTGYGYDGRGNLRSITYPTGRVVSYDVDAANRITRVFDSTGKTYANNLTFHPSGGIKTLTFGNGLTESTTFDGRYRPSHRISGPLDVTYGYDPGGNVTSIADARPGFNSSFSYDVLDRLTTTTGWGANQYQYNALGNRIWEANGGVSSFYDDKLRLISTESSGGSASYSYDAVGNLTAEGLNAFTYTPFDRMRTASVNGLETAYGYDGDQQRVVRTDAQGTTYSIRGPGGQVLAEYEDAGMQAQLVREYIYLGSKLVASIGRPASAAEPEISVALTSPSSGSTALAGASVTFAAQPYVSSGGVASIEFYLNGHWLGSDTMAPYAISRTDTPAGTHRVLAMVIANNGKVASSAVATLTVVAPNAPPSVSLTSPTSGTAVGTGKSVTLTASAADANGIQRVEFYKGSLLLATDTTAPYSFEWSDLQTGTYTLTAKAFDALGSSTISTPATLTVSPIASVSISPVSPTAGAAALVTVDGAAFCTSVNLDFGDGQTQTLINETGLPMTASHAWATAGAKTVTATGLGAACDYQATKQATVLTPPSVSISAPESGATFTEPATIAMTASASAAQGTIAAVDFLANGTLLYTDTTAPFAFSRSDVGAGSYALTARATDTQGAVATSSSVNVIVGTPPPSTVLGLTVSPSVAGQPATVTVTGTNPCGMLWMDFGDGDWWIAPISDLPFQTTHTWATSGTYTVMASGYMVCGGQVTKQVSVSSALPLPQPASMAIIAGEPSSAFQFEPGPAAMEPVHVFSHPNDTGTTGDLSWSDAAEDVQTDMLVWDHAVDGPYVTGDLPLSADESAPPSAPIPSATVTIVLSGTGAGTVTGSVACSGSSTTCSGAFAPGQGVTVTATPAAGSVFTGWTGVCATTSATCGLGAVDGIVVVANFRSTFAAETVYYHLDVVGSVRAVTDAAGAVIERHDYRPFGEDNMPLPAAGADSSRFLGQQRDGTKLDLFGVRYYSMFRGRFTSVDPGHADASITEPQGWNVYAYSRNNPLRWVDTSGLCKSDPDRGVFCLVHDEEYRPDPFECFYLSSSCGVGSPRWSPPDQVGDRQRQARAGRDAVAPAGAGTGTEQGAGDVLPAPPTFGPIPPPRLPVSLKIHQDSSTPDAEDKGVIQCVAEQFGFHTVAGAGAVAAGYPIPNTKPFVTPGSSRGTSLAGMAANRIFGGARLPIRMPTLVGGPFTGRALAVAGTKSVARFAGRLVPVVGWGLVGYDAVSITVCTAR